MVRSISIKQRTDLHALNELIGYYKLINKCSPILLMNVSTSNLLVDLMGVEFINIEGEEVKPRAEENATIGIYEGCKMFIDDDLEDNLLEVR